jgi:hypothetical protein
LHDASPSIAQVYPVTTPNWYKISRLGVEVTLVTQNREEFVRLFPILTAVLFGVRAKGYEEWRAA